MDCDHIADVVFAPETIGGVLAGTPIVLCADPTWELLVNSYNHEIAKMVAAGQCRPNTMLTYGYAARAIARAAATLSLSPSRLGDQDVRNLVREARRLDDRYAGAATEAKIRAYLSGLLRFHAAQEGPKSRYIERLLWAGRGIRLPGLLPLRRKFVPRLTPTDAEIRALHGAAHTDDERLLLRLLHGIGARRAEARTITTGDVFKLKKQLEGDRTPRLRVTGKGAKTRHVPVERSLAAWFVAIAEQRLRAGANPTTPIVANRFGRPMSDSGVNDVIARLSKRANVSDITPHALRRKFTDDWAEAHGKDGGLPFSQLRVLAAILGHSGVGSLKHYLTPQSGVGHGRGSP